MDTNAQNDLIDVTSEGPGSSHRVCVPGGFPGRDTEAETWLQRFHRGHAQEQRLQRALEAGPGQSAAEWAAE